jgi:2,3-bisphosphoglycerate-dependent phosphoglycerate mutase
MPVEIVYETHAISEDNERGIATGWLPGRLSAQGRELAAQLGQRRRDDGIAAVFSSDLQRAAETTQIAFDGSDIPVLYDWRLRECDFGRRNGTSAPDLRESRLHHLDHPYPDGESWRGAVRRVSGVLADLPVRWAGQRVMVVGHVATRFALDHVINGVALEELIMAEFEWQEGWEYRLGSGG